MYRASSYPHRFGKIFIYGLSVAIPISYVYFLGKEITCITEDLHVRGTTFAIKLVLPKAWPAVHKWCKYTDAGWDFFTETDHLTLKCQKLKHKRAESPLIVYKTVENVKVKAEIEKFPYSQKFERGLKFQPIDIQLPGHVSCFLEYSIVR